MPQKTSSVKTCFLGVVTILLGLLAGACGGEVLTPFPTSQKVSPTIAVSTITVPAITSQPEVHPTAVAGDATVEQAASEQSTAAEQAAPDTPEASAGTIDFAIYKLEPNSEEATVLKDAGEMTQDDLYGIYFKPVDHPYFIYILQQDSTDAVDIIFPNASYSSRTNPVLAGEEVWVPRDFNNWFYLDENKGQEAILLVATRERNLDLEALVLTPPQPGELSKDDFKEALRQSLINSQVASETRGLGGVVAKKASTLIFPDGNIRNVDVDAIGGTVDYVYKVGFEHK